MKQASPVGILILLFLLLPGCRQGHHDTPPEFSAYKDNPILSPGEPGSWDELFVWTPRVIYYADTFYMFYHGGNINGKMAIGIAVSVNGHDFKKYEGNPILSPSGNGFDSFTVGPGIVIQSDSLWIMYYNSQDMIAFAPGKHAGRATASSPEGPWKRSEQAVISSGNAGEWDAGFIIPSTVLLLDDGTFLMFYSGGKELSQFDDFYVGLATSSDGVSWKKYNDPKTGEHPYRESDPVLVTGDEGDWDGAFVWMANVSYLNGLFMMYYAGAGGPSREELKSIGYATSKDGINWTKYTENPIYRTTDDPFIISRGRTGFMENPIVLLTDSIIFMYYECGPAEIQKSFISLATAHVP